MAGREAPADLSPAFLESFCRLLMAGEYRAAERILRTMTESRARHSRMADGILAAAARHLGAKWENDEASFGEVSIGVAQIFRLNQAFGQRNLPWVRNTDQRLAVFATLPGQGHNLGLVLAAEAFRQENWQVDLLLDTPGHDVVERVRRMRPEAVGLSISTFDRKHQMAHLVGELRALPIWFRIMLGGTAAAELAETLPKGWRVEVVQGIDTALRED
ncbi:cobalamin B12-binding domain-containing protein [Roseibacterium sp. SDUM158016]|uniref:cobalamin B12-binding domain-containing protein n=1 Tax=Roseicyclus sediminis TaxID=2980997 RepID=UPI0021D06B23|nr:cobalamin B12-binding domain-containing protein [Roseibacterium sp. SDUM158016]MCU4654890.1 cobalamin B12-binding domain-containing protein [Roseibacterium sp. SDUM158016]